MKMLFAILLSILSLNCEAAARHPIKVAVIDTGLDLSDPRFKKHLCSAGHHTYVGADTKDYHGHGTHVAGLIAQYAGDSNYCLMIYKFYSEYNPGSVNMRNEIAAIRQAVKDGASIVNFSGGGPDFNEEEMSVIRDNPSVTFVVAAGNDGEDLDKPGNGYYPASYFLPNEIVVENKCGRSLSGNSNHSFRAKAQEIGCDVVSTVPCHINREGDKVCLYALSGTSMSTAIHTGKMVRDMVRYSR